MDRKEIKEIENLSRERVQYIINTYCGGNRTEFCKRTGIGKSSVSQYINGTNAPGSITASKIGNAFHINPMWIMGFDVPMTEESSDLINNTLLITAEENGLEQASRILKWYLALNKAGKAKADDYLQDLSEQDKYTNGE